VVNGNLPSNWMIPDNLVRLWTNLTKSNPFFFKG